jgi:hypothetical protein
MGRLTLNILLSFAQFEREVTGERIRDKFEASRKKGLWIAGATPYGYNKQGSHILVPEYPYANNLQKIFELYLELGTVEKLYKKLPELKILSRTQKPFSRGMLYRILADKVYIGKIVYKDKCYDGQHEPLISEDLFNEVQNLLKQHSQERKFSINSKESSLLTGLIYDDMGNRMTPSHGNKKGKRYRYYITKTHKLEDYQTELMSASGLIDDASGEYEMELMMMEDTPDSVGESSANDKQQRKVDSGNNSKNRNNNRKNNNNNNNNDKQNSSSNKNNNNRNQQGGGNKANNNNANKPQANGGGTAHQTSDNKHSSKKNKNHHPKKGNKQNNNNNNAQDNK